MNLKKNEDFPNVRLTGNFGYVDIWTFGYLDTFIFGYLHLMLYRYGQPKLNRRFGKPGFTWIHLDPFGFTWIHLGSLGLTSLGLTSLRLT